MSARAAITAAIPVRPASQLLKALGDESRLRIVALLAHRELCVCHLEAALALPQPTVSRHLAVLRAAGVVESRRDARWIYYRLAPQQDEVCRGLLESLTHSFATRQTVRKDLERLVQACGPGSCD